MVTLRGRHVLLRPLRLEDAAEMRALVAGPRETFRWTSVPRTDEVDAYIARALSPGMVAFATCAAGSGELLGSTRFFDLQRWDWNRPEPHEYDGCEIGYTWLAEKAQRTAANTEAKLLMLAHAFDTWRVLRVTLKTDERNERSRRAIERLGARFDGVLRASMAAVDGRPRNSAYYSILAEEWPAVRARLEERLR
ncbi:MAG TPA: GNAT family protein [Myxococcales bacterium]|nr:GNAT family protein [Myxococcales bacterium]